MNMQLSLSPDSPHWAAILAKRDEYLRRTENQWYPSGSPMLPLEHCKVFLIDLLVKKAGQPLTWEEFIASLESQPNEFRRCYFIGAPYGSSLQEAWGIIDRYLNHHGSGLHNSSGYQTTI